MLDKVHFLIGAERSGTTLLRLMLDHHPKLAWCSEFEYAVDKLRDPHRWPAMGRFRIWLRNDRIYQLHGWRIDEKLNYPDLMKSFLYQKRGGKPLVGATVHRHYRRLLRIWPDARFIYLIRDGRDVGKSCIAQGWNGNMYHAVDAWIEAERSWQALRAELPPDRWMEVRYETLISDSVGTLRRICEFLGVAYDARMFDYVNDSSYELPDPANASQWKRKHTDEEIQLAECKIADLLRIRGYELSGLPLLKMTPRLATQLQRQDRRARSHARRRMLGFWTAGMDAISRRLRLRPLELHFNQRSNEIINRNIK